MATYKGKDGVVKISTATVAEVRSFSLTESAATMDDSAMGDDWSTHLVGLKSWSGSIECHWDDTDTTGQEAMTVGASVTLHLHPEGAESTDEDLTGTATITNIEIGASLEGVVSRTFQFQGNGELTHGAVGS